MALSPARRLACYFLQKLEDAEITLGELMFSGAMEKLQAADRNLVTELVYGVLRHRSLLDQVLQICCHTPLSALDRPVLQALRLGSYQILFLSRIPRRAAVYESVEMVKWLRLRSSSALVNAVLRRVSMEKLDHVRSNCGANSVETLALRFSHPEWLVERWICRYPLSAVQLLLELNNRPPPVFFRANALDLTPDSMERLLRADGVRIEWIRPGEGRGRVLEGDLYRADLFRQGKIVIQDAGSQWIPFLLEPRPGEKILDLCSAPGGKTSEIAWLTRDQAEVLAVDVSFSRLLAAKNRQSSFWKHIHHVAADGLQSLPCRGRFDKILVDAPCSGTGTLRRNPDIRWKLDPKKLSELQSRQLLFLENATPHLRPGGILVYSTCSLEEEENEKVVEIFLNRHPEFHLTMPDAPNLRTYFDSRLHFHLLPSEANADGFFAAVLKKDPWS